MSSENTASLNKLAQLPPEFLAADRSAPLLHSCVALIIIETLFFVLFIASRLVLKIFHGIETWCFMPAAYLLCIASCVLGICMYRHRR